MKLTVYKNLTDPCILLIVYTTFEKNEASGINSVAVENITLASILSLSLELRRFLFFPKPTKKVFIPKTNGKMRPLGISSSKDKIVQKTILLMLEPLFENVFLDFSHGSRINRSCHSALKTIYYK
jgi:retron-type reverse transcriptase